MLVFVIEDFNRAKESLLKYYSDVQVSLGARLIGFGVALFTLLEAFRNFNSDKLSQMIFGEILTFPLLPLIQGILLFHGILLLVTYMVRTILRYAAISGFCNALVGVVPFKINDETIVHAEISKKAYEIMNLGSEGKGTRVFRIFPFGFFLGGDMGEGEKERMKRDNYLGWFWSLLIGALITFAMFILFW